jgi:tellurite resistance protein
MAYEVRVDCPSCLVEGTRIETWDASAPSCRLGVPELVVCRLCGHAAEGRVPSVTSPAPGEGCPGCGAALDDASRDAHRCPYCGALAMLEQTVVARPIRTLTELDRALAIWARDEGLASPDDLIDAYFVLPNLEDVFEAIARGERVETTFDVADYLFSGGGAGGAAAAGPAIMREEEAPSTQRTRAPVSLRRVGGPREELRALASVAAADGEASVDDQAVLRRAAEKRGIPLLAPEDVRVWRPNEIDPPATLNDRERVLEEMFQMAWSDGQLDDSELRVIKDFARAWGIDPERVKEWMELYSFGDSNRIERWLRRIGFFLFPAR